VYGKNIGTGGPALLHQFAGDTPRGRFVGMGNVKGEKWHGCCFGEEEDMRI